VSRAVLSQSPRDVYARKTLAGQLDIRVSFVVAQENVVARLPLFDEIVFERERFFFIIDVDVIDSPRLADQRSGLDVGQPVVIEITADAAAQIFGFADVQHGSMGVLVEVNARQGGQLGSSVAELENFFRSSIFARDPVLYWNCATRPRTAVERRIGHRIIFRAASD